MVVITPDGKIESLRPFRPQRSRSEGFMSSVITGAAEDWLLQEAHAKDAARRLNIADPSIPVGTASFEMRRRALL